MDRRKYRRQEDPFNVTLELTQGCNLHCPFCAMPAIQDKPGRGYKFMEEKTITNVMQQIAKMKWNCRVGFAMRGEPTMHPNYTGMVAIVRQHLPKAHITMLTNGGGLVRKPGPVANVVGLFNAGLNVLGLDDYQNVKFVPKIIEAINQEGNLISGSDHRLGFKFYKYPQDLKGNPHIRRPRGTKTLVQIRDIAAQDADKKIGTHGKLFNYAGLSFKPNDSMAGKRCHHPFRQFVVHWDGNVPLCCNSWDSPYNCGNVNEQSMESIWQGNAMGAAREMLIKGKREFTPCKGCDHRSYRVGLLPDLMGKGRLHTPDAQTAKDIQAALATGARAEIVRIPWKER
jgi:radical SAM protein with 4Fe4S-binding SPASM domain